MSFDSRVWCSYPPPPRTLAQVALWPGDKTETTRVGTAESRRTSFSSLIQHLGLNINETMLQGLVGGGGGEGRLGGRDAEFLQVIEGNVVYWKISQK